MAKDPAINWYFDNWGGGTRTMSRFLKGCYIDLLDAQFHSGHLSLDEIKHVLGADFSAWQTLQKKFAQDVHGNYFNERLDHEINKRLENSKKQSEKVKKRWDEYRSKNNGNTAVLPQDGTGIGTETKTDSKEGTGGKKKKEFVPPTLQEFQDYWEQSGFRRDVALRAWTGYEANSWKDARGNKVKNWKQKSNHVWFKDENKIQNGTNRQNHSVGRVSPDDKL